VEHSALAEWRQERRRANDWRKPADARMRQRKAIRALKQAGELEKGVLHRQVKYLNNRLGGVVVRSSC
jgi:transposase-like protein